jgi:hypothetical protein
LKAAYPIVFTDDGIKTDIKLLHPVKALVPMEVTELGMVYVPVFEVGHCINVVCVLLNKAPSKLE